MLGHAWIHRLLRAILSLHPRKPGAAWFNRRLDWRMFWNAMDTTTRISTMVVFILLGSTMFSSIFQGFYGGVWIEHLLTGLPGGVVGASQAGQLRTDQRSPGVVLRRERRRQVGVHRSPVGNTTVVLRRIDELQRRP